MGCANVVEPKSGQGGPSDPRQVSLPLRRVALRNERDARRGSLRRNPSVSMTILDGAIPCLIGLESPLRISSTLSILGSSIMRLSLIRAAMFALALGVLLARPGFAQTQGQITDVTTNGTTTGPPMPPLPLVLNLSITNIQNRNDSVAFDAYLFSTGPLDFNVTVSGPGMYFIGNGRVFNVTDFAGPGTGIDFSGLEATLENAPAGSQIGSYERDPKSYASATVINPTTIVFNGPPGIPVEQSAFFNVGYDITGSGPQTFEVVLAPQTVPEPSTLVMGLIAAVAGLGFAARRRRRQG